MTAMTILALIIGWIGAVLIALFGIAIVVLIFIGRIDLTKLISEQDGTASMSRFQFLIFTFVIALSLFLVAINKMEVPDIPAGVFALLGISAGSYVISKGIQTSRDISLRGAAPPPPPAAAAPLPPPPPAPAAPAADA